MKSQFFKTRLKTHLIDVGFAIALLTLLSTAWFSHRSVQQAIQDQQRAGATREMLKTLQFLRVCTVQLDLTARSYLASGQEHFLNSFENLGQTFHHGLSTLRAIENSDAIEQQRMDEFESTARDYLDAMNKAFLLKRVAEQMIINPQTPKLDRADQLFGSMRQSLAEMENSGDQQIRLAAVRSQSSIGNSMKILWVRTAINTSILMAIYYLLRKQTRHRYEAELKAQSVERMTQSLVDNSTAVIYVKDLDGRYLLINRLYETLFHVKSEQMLGKTDHDLFEKEMADAYRANDDYVLRSRMPVRYEEVAPQDDGMHYYISLKYPLLDESGEARAMCGISTDITDRKNAEEAVHQLNLELEERVIERTRQLEAVNCELEAFTSTVAHDLRSPLQIVHGFAQLLQRDFSNVLGENGTPMLSAIVRRTRQMRDLITDLLNLAHIRQRDITKTTIGMNEMLNEILEEISTLDDGHRAEIIPGDLPPAWGDPVMIRQVLLNLLLNAIKYSSKASAPRITIEGRRSDSETIFCVRDNGIGFNAEQAGRLFRIFQRLHTEQYFEGSGVGLAIVERGITRHEGRVWAEPNDGGGAAFFFALPIESGVQPVTDSASLLQCRRLAERRRNQDDEWVGLERRAKIRRQTDLQRAKIRLLAPDRA